MSLSLSLSSDLAIALFLLPPSSSLMKRFSTWGEGKLGGFLLNDPIAAYLNQHLVNLLWLFQFRCREGFILPFGPFLKIFKWIVEKMEATWRIYCSWPCSWGSCQTSSWSSGSQASCASRSSGSWSGSGRTQRTPSSEACRSSSWDVTIKKSIVKPKLGKVQIIKNVP